MIDVIDKKIEELIDTINNEEIIVRFKKLKKIMKEDKEKRLLLEEYNSQTEDSKLISIKKRLYDDPLIKEYFLLEAEIHYFLLYLNKKISSLIGIKVCQKSYIQQDF